MARCRGRCGYHRLRAQSGERKCRQCPNVAKAGKDYCQFQHSQKDTNPYGNQRQAYDVVRGRSDLVRANQSLHDLYVGDSLPDDFSKMKLDRSHPDNVLRKRTSSVDYEYERDHILELQECHHLVRSTSGLDEDQTAFAKDVLKTIANQCNATGHPNLGFTRTYVNGIKGEAIKWVISDDLSNDRGNYKLIDYLRRPDITGMQIDENIVINICQARKGAFSYVEAQIQARIDTLIELQRSLSNLKGIMDHDDGNDDIVDTLNVGAMRISSDS